MDRRTRTGFIASAAAFIAFALARLLGATAPAEPITHTVLIEGMRFVPATVQISPGDRVLFQNKDILPHTATARESKAFDSGLIKPGGEWTVQPAGEQPITFACLYHPTMTGKIVIQVP